MKKIKLLIVTNVNYNILIRELISEIYRLNRDFEIDILSPETNFKIEGLNRHIEYKAISTYKNKIIRKFQKGLFLFHFKNKVSNLPFYDIINIHFVDEQYASVFKTLKTKTKKIITTVWGSDFYRASQKGLGKKQSIFKNSDCLTFTNRKLQEDLFSFYQLEKPYKIITFGTTILSEVDKFENDNYAKLCDSFGFPNDKIIISIGYNASAFQQHDKILQALVNLPQTIKDKIFLCIPMTYAGSPKYANDIERQCKELEIESKVLKDYLTNDEIARLRKISKIMIHMPTTDQFSGSMLESMYAGNIIIKGAWLKYPDLDTKRAYYIDVMSFNELKETFENIINNINYHLLKTKVNKKIVFDIYSWDKASLQWNDFYNNILKA